MLLKRLLLWVFLLPWTAKAFADPLYLNVLVEDASKVVQGKIQEKVAKAPGPFKRLVSYGAMALASKVATPSRVAQKMSEKMPKKMTQKMNENGLSVLVEPVYREGPYFVLKLVVLKVSADKLVATAMREKMGQPDSQIPLWIKRVQAWMGEKPQSTLENEVIPALVQSRLKSEMPKMMGTKLTDKGMQAEINVMENESKQDKFFQQQIEKVRKLGGDDNDYSKLKP